MLKAIAAVCLLIAVTAPDPAWAGFKMIPAKLFVVKNNSAAVLACSAGDGASWDAWFNLTPGAEWERKVQDGGPKMFIRCKPPAAAVAYPLKGGMRYSFLREVPGGPVKLKLISTTKD